MDRENRMYFQNALSNFIFDVACGGAIRHLAAQGNTSRQIAASLSFPVSYERVREAVTKYFLDEGIILRKSPADGERQEKYIYVQDHGKYGRTSFRRVPVRQDAQPQAPSQREQVSSQRERAQGKLENTQDAGAWTERRMSHGELAEWLRKPKGINAVCGSSGGDNAAHGNAAGKVYAACCFVGDGAEFEGCETLDERQREYLQGIVWSKCRSGRQPAYHLLNDRMREIVLRLCEGGSWRGKIYLEGRREILVPPEETDTKGVVTKALERKDGLI